MEGVIMMKFIEYIQYLCAVIALSFVFIVVMMKAFEIDAHNHWSKALVFPCGFASVWICNVLYDVSNYLKNNERNRSKKKTLRD